MVGVITRSVMVNLFNYVITISDIDECQNERTCHEAWPCPLIKRMTCTNKPGTYECKCEKGYKFKKHWIKCQDSCIGMNIS